MNCELVRPLLGFLFRRMMPSLPLLRLSLLLLY
nr:MAG TPA: hypothetical protein [Caudoviricetes sp.]